MLDEHFEKFRRDVMVRRKHCRPDIKQHRHESAT